MDNWLLTAAAHALHRRLAGAVLADWFQEAGHRFRLGWTHDDATIWTSISLLPEAPWIGESGPAPRKRPPSGRFAASMRRQLAGEALTAIEKPTSDRWLRLRFATGRSLILELAVHGANVTLLDEQDRVVESMRRPRKAADRYTVGQPWTPAPLPTRLVDPFTADAAAIDAALDDAVESGETIEQALKRRLFAVGSAAAALLTQEADSTQSLGQRLKQRCDAALAGTLAPVLEPDVALWPWDPADGRTVESGDPARLAARWYGKLENDGFRESRLKALLTILSKEHRRARLAADRASSDLAGFEDPERYRRRGVALLAGLHAAQRHGEMIQVPDPESLDGSDLVFQAPPHLSLPEVAERMFDRHRRAQRGRERARQRVEELQQRQQRLERLQQQRDELDEATLEQGLRELGIAVGLRASQRGTRLDRQRRLPRLEGVRVYQASDGTPILAGRGGKENHRLTFKLASPDDHWFHALGVPGAHVILRAEASGERPIQEAAAVAAFHSDAKAEEWVDVQWTRRKNVKKPRGAAMGTVVLKRFETLRVRPCLPSNGERID